MNFKRLFALTILILTTIGLGGAVLAQDMNTEIIEQDIRAASTAWDEAFNADDLDALLDLYADDVISLPPGLSAREGQDALQADFEFIFETYDASHETDIVDIHIAGDTAIEYGQYTMTFDPVDGSEDFVETGRHMLVREFIDGEWKIVWEIWNTFE